MDPLRFTRVRRLAEAAEASLALTAYLPVPEAEGGLSAIQLGKVQSKAEKALAKHSDLKEAESFRTNLEYALQQVSESSLRQGTWLIGVTPAVSEAVFLPFALPEEISVGKALKPNPALYALYRTQATFVGLISENTARWFEGLDSRLFSMPLQSELKDALHQLHKARQQIQNISLESPQYSELFAQMARSAYSMALVKYLDTLQSVLSYYLQEEQVPLLLMGEDRILQELMRRLEPKARLTLISGVPETAPLEVIQQHVAQHLSHQRTVLEQMYAPFLAYSEPQTPKEIWELLQDTLPTTPILFIQEGYDLPAQELVGSKRSLPTKDGIDLLVAAVREKNGHVLFAPAERLPHPLVLILP